MFRGIASVTMDSRGRMALPSRFREEAEQRTENRLVATIDTNEQCLLLYSLGDWEEVQRRLEALSNIGTSARLLQRLLIGHARVRGIGEENRTNGPNQQTRDME